MLQVHMGRFIVQIGTERYIICFLCSLVFLIYFVLFFSFSLNLSHLRVGVSLPSDKDYCMHVRTVFLAYNLSHTIQITKEVTFRSLFLNLWEMSK